MEIYRVNVLALKLAFLVDKNHINLEHFLHQRIWICIKKWQNQLRFVTKSGIFLHFSRM